MKRHPTQTQDWLIRQLNPALRGWANYHRHVVAKETFSYVDYRVWKLLWRWCCRRHKNRYKRWVKTKYFHTVGNRHWTFQWREDKENPVTLVYAKDTVIKRHTKIKAEANPYLPEWEPYFEQRLERRWKETMQGRKKLLALWLRQEKRCPLCNQLITLETGWHVHHKHQKHLGGGDELENLVMLHPGCHIQWHVNEEKDAQLVQPVG